MIYDAIPTLYDYMSITVYLRVLQLFAFMICNLCYIVSVLYYLNISFYTPFISFGRVWGVSQIKSGKGGKCSTRCYTAGLWVFLAEGLSRRQRAWPVGLPFLAAADAAIVQLLARLLQVKRSGQFLIYCISLPIKPFLEFILIFQRSPKPQKCQASQRTTNELRRFRNRLDSPRAHITNGQIHLR